MADRKRKRMVQQQPDRRANRTILVRTLFLLTLFGVAAFVPLLVRLWQIQIRDYDKYQGMAVEQQTADSTVEANRGTIYDRSGETLAMSATVYNIQLSPKEILACQEAYREKAANAAENGKTLDYPEPTNEFIASNLAQLLDLDEADILNRLTKTSSMYEMIKWRVEDDERDAVISFINENHITGIYTPPTTKRYYPKNSLAAQVIGWVNYSEGRGAYGVEAQYDEALSGETGRIVTAKNGDGTQMLYRYEDYYDATDGDNLTLTLDSAIQSYCESILKKGIEQFEVQDGGFCIAMDPNTGEILAWANSPTYDLNNPRVVSDPVLNQYLADIESGAYTKEEAYQKALAEGASSEEARDKAISAAETEVLYTQWTNKAITSTYEPGSTFKSIVLAAALEEGVVNMNTTFTCTGSIHVEGWGKPINCSKRAGHGTQTLKVATGNSCNPAFVTMGLKIGTEAYYRYLKSFGLMETTGIDLPAEAEGIFANEDSFNSNVVSLAAYSFGQTFNVTPLELIRAQAATINGGYLYTPYLVEQVLDDEGNILSQHETTAVRQVISEETSAKVRECLEWVVSDGGGRNGQVTGYRIGGKTGTADKTGTKDVVVSFMCFAPADDPQYIMLLTMDTPSRTTGTAVFGGTMVAPVASQIMSEILPLLGVEPDYTAEELVGADTTVPNVVGQTREAAEDRLADLGFTFRTVGDGDTVTDQTPAGGAIVPGNASIILYLGQEKPDTPCTVPNVVGKSASEANKAITNAGLIMKVTGTTTASSGNVYAITQSLPAGTEVAAGTVVTVQFGDNSVLD
mgnify:CR=1 FL=1